MSFFPVGKEKEMVNFLINTLENLHTENIYTLWDAPLSYSFYNESGILNNTPMAEFLTNLMNNNFPEGPKRMMEVGTVDVNTGNFVTYNEKD
jgi:hypothetical protein